MEKIVTDIKQLKIACDPAGVEEGIALGKRLIKILGRHINGVGVAANQIGIKERVSVVNVRKPIILVNPKIISSFGKVEFNESCLSFGRDIVLTERFKNILVKADNYQTDLPFYGNTWDELLECVCVQHEIDHLNGITMYDRRAIGGEE